MQTCPTTGKLQYEDRESARRAADATRRKERPRYGSRMQAFKCGECDKFHIGHARGAIWERR